MSLRGSGDAPRERPPWRREEIFAADGTSLAAYRLGAAPGQAEVTVVIAHGWTLTAAAWDGVAQRLVASRPGTALVAYDQRGHGASQPGSASATMALLAADLTAVASACAPTGPLVLVGHSMGGMALLVAAGAEPSLLADRPSALLLCSTTAGGPRWLGTKARAAPLMQALALLPPHLHVRRVPNRVLARVSYAPDTALDVVAGTNAAMGALSLRSVGAWFGAFNEHDASDVLPALAAAGSEVTVVVGDADRLTPLENSLALAQALPQARLRVVPGTGHMLFVERPDVVAEEILRLVDHLAERPPALGCPPHDGAMSEQPYPYAPPPGGPEGRAPRAAGPPETASPRPRTVSTAITLVWVTIGLYLLSIVVLLASGYLTDALAATETAGEPVPPGMQGLIVTIAVVVGGFFLLLYVGSGVLLALMLRAGRSWPRIVLAIGAGLFSLGLVLNVVQAIAFAVSGPSFLVPVATPVLQIVVSALEVAALAAAVVLLFQRPSSAWFAERRAARLRARGQDGVGTPGGEGGFPQGDQRPDHHR